MNAFTHLIAACVFSVLGYYLVRRGRGNWIRMASLAVMAVSSVFLLSMSGVYHMLGPGAGRDILRQLDIVGITLRTIFGASLPFGVGTAIFLVFGWAGVISGILLWRRYGFSFVKPLVGGGVAYTLGAIALGLN